MSRWNCGSFWWNGTWLMNSSQVRHAPAPGMPAMSPTRPSVIPSTSRRCGSIAARYTSMPGRSGDGRAGGDPGHEEERPPGAVDRPEDRSVAYGAVPEEIGPHPGDDRDQHAEGDQTGDD